MDTCYRCEWYREGEEGTVCRVTGVGIFDVVRARAIVRRRRRRAVHLKPRQLRRLTELSDTYRPHLAHVNTRKCGIVGRYRTEDGQVIEFMLEGNHRAARAIQSGRPFRVHRLTNKETAEIFIGRQKPRGLIWRQR
jgi:hypothetical protein